MLVDTQPLRHLRNRIAPLGDLRYRVPFEIVAEIGFAHHGLLASKLGKKASTNLGAIHFAKSANSAIIRGVALLHVAKGLSPPGQSGLDWRRLARTSDFAESY
jgi:hypothetical protein